MSPGRPVRIPIASMASALSHAIVAVGLGTALSPSKTPLKLWLLGVGCAVVPDVDVIGYWLGVPYDAMLGHRGLTHSLAFAAAVSILVVTMTFRGERWAGCRSHLLLYFFSATASHGVLDAMTNGGLGVAFFAPFDNARYFFPFHPIEVSPRNVKAFFTARGVAILWSELLWIWLPTLLITALLLVRRRRQATGHLATTRS